MKFLIHSTHFPDTPTSVEASTPEEALHVYLETIFLPRGIHQLECFEATAREGDQPLFRTRICKRGTNPASSSGADGGLIF
ncbi:MAG: hypothetical protein AAF191_17330 [Verrucomicrobiota bacterium]